MSYFSKAKVGDKVWDYVYGEGEVTCFFPTRELKLGIDFGNFETVYYNYDGKQHEHDNQRLFYFDNRPIVITQDDLELDKNAISFWICEDGLRASNGDDLDGYRQSFMATRKVHSEETETPSVENLTNHFGRWIKEENEKIDMNAINNAFEFIGKKYNLEIWIDREKNTVSVKIDGKEEFKTDISKETPEFVKDIVKEESEAISEENAKILESEVNFFWEHLSEGVKCLYEYYEKQLEDNKSKPTLSKWFFNKECLTALSNIEKRVAELEKLWGE